MPLQHIIQRPEGGAEKNGFGLVRTQLVDETGQIDLATTELDIDPPRMLLDVVHQVLKQYLQKVGGLSDYQTKIRFPRKSKKPADENSLSIDDGELNRKANEAARA